MTSKMNVAYLERGSAYDHLRAIRSEKIITSDMVDSNGKVKCMVHQSSSQYGVIGSTISHVCIWIRVQMPEIMKR